MKQQEFPNIRKLESFQNLRLKRFCILYGRMQKHDILVGKCTMSIIQKCLLFHLFFTIVSRGFSLFLLPSFIFIQVTSFLFSEDQALDYPIFLIDPLLSIIINISAFSSKLIAALFLVLNPLSPFSDSYSNLIYDGLPEFSLSSIPNIIIVLPLPSSVSPSDFHCLPGSVLDFAIKTPSLGIHIDYIPSPSSGQGSLSQKQISALSTETCVSFNLCFSYFNYCNLLLLSLKKFKCVLKFPGEEKIRR